MIRSFHPRQLLIKKEVFLLNENDVHCPSYPGLAPEEVWKNHLWCGVDTVVMKIKLFSY